MVWSGVPHLHSYSVPVIVTFAWPKVVHMLICVFVYICLFVYLYIYAYLCVCIQQ